MEPNKLLGKKVVNVLRVSELFAGEEMSSHGASMAIQFDDGSMLVPASDDEFNGFGTMYVFPKNGTENILWGNSTATVVEK